MRSQAKAGASAPPGQESTVPEKLELHQSSRVERRLQGVRAGPQEGGDALRLPGTLTEQLRHGESAPSSLKGCSAHALTRELLGGARAAAPQRGLRGPGSSSGAAWAVAPAEKAAQPGARFQQRRPGSTGRRGHCPGPTLPLRQAEARRAQDSKDAPAPS